MKDNQNLFPIKLSFIGAYDLIAGGTFKLLATGNELKNGLIIPVKIHRIRFAKMSSNTVEMISNASCVFNNDIFTCQWKNIGNPDQDIYYLRLEKEGDTIEWINPGNYDIVWGKYYQVYYSQLIYCYYDEANNYYKYSIQLSQSLLYKDDIYVMDILINNFESYGVCTYKEVNTLECFTSVKTRNNNDTVTVLITRKRGNVDWRELTVDTDIYPKNYLFAEVNVIYDLKYNINKWEFKIKYNYISDFLGTKKIDILVDEEKSTVDCELIGANENILKCTNESYNKDQLIKLNRNWVSNEHLFLYNTRHNGIPLISIFEFKSASNLKYSNGWSFIIKVNTSDLSIIPRGSTFSIDIKYDNNNNELAFCTETGRQNNELTLLCAPYNKLGRNLLITLSNGEKSNYSSVTWSSFISDENTIVYMDLELNVEYVTFPEYDTSTNKWKFQMIFFDDDVLPLNAKTKIKIDIKYNDEEALATCNLIEQNKFECSPDVSPQNKNDKFSILSNKNKGTVTFINSPEILKFIIKLYYEKTLNFKMEDKCTFEIELTKINMEKGYNIQIDIIIDENKNKANCEFDLNGLKCEFDYDKENKPKIIKIINDKTNEEFKWVNIPDEFELFREIIIPETTHVQEEIKEIEKTTELIIKKNIYGYYYNTVEKIFIIEEDDPLKTGDIILKEIRKKLNNGEINSSYLINGHYFIVEYNNIRYIISTLEEKDENIPSINFGECPSKLKASKNLPEDTILYILYIEVTEEGINIPNIEYEIYSLSEEQKYEIFNLIVCKDIKIEKAVSVSINISESDF